MYNELINAIVAKELDFFINTRSIDGPTHCQSQHNSFIFSRTAYWNVYPKEILESYNEDLDEAIKNKLNLVAFKYGYMMKTTAPEEYRNIEPMLPTITLEKSKIVEVIISISIYWENEVRMNNPELVNKNRPLYSKEDTLEKVSIETYFRGELYTYSQKTLMLILDFYRKSLKNNDNLVHKNLLFLSKKNK